MDRMDMSKELHCVSRVQKIMHTGGMLLYNWGNKVTNGKKKNIGGQDRMSWSSTGWKYLNIAHLRNDCYRT